jgi:transitional endoplasmic reticulum ATPase
VSADSLTLFVSWRTVRIYLHIPHKLHLNASLSFYSIPVISAADLSFRHKNIFKTLNMEMSVLMASISSGSDMAYEKYISHFDNKYGDTQVVMASALRLQYPGLKLTTCDASVHDLMGFANAGKATMSILDPGTHRVIRQVNQPSRKVGLPGMRMVHQDDEVATGDPADGETENGSFSSQIKFGRYLYLWNNQQYLVYLADGLSSGRFASYYYILCEASLEDEERLSSKAIDRLMHAASSWAMESEDEILVFNQGRWGKDKELFKSVQSTSWDDVILESSMKSSLVKDVEEFFNVEDIYKDLNVPWKVRLFLLVYEQKSSAYEEESRLSCGTIYSKP